jgi:chorismate lyase / 3-hydroxybenzoate synthase
MSTPSPGDFSAGYRTGQVADWLDRRGTLAVIGFGDVAVETDPRCLRVPLAPVDGAAPLEHWGVDAPVEHGDDDGVRWAAGAGWRYVAIELDESRYAGLENASEHAYRRLLDHIGAQRERHLQRVWNYLYAINEGEGDAERYRRFCVGRLRVMDARKVERYPAASAIGHHGPRGLLQVYALCAAAPGRALENPRQVSAWRYPRVYGPASPSFARAMCLPDGALAISGTAAVVGHASHHEGDVRAQTEEAFANLHALLEGAGLPAFDARSPLKIYVRHREDAGAVRAVLARHLDPAVPRLLLHGDICRRELLAEIDGFRFAR